MAKEILAIKESYLKEFIEILQKGMAETEKEQPISEPLKDHLETWIEETKEYLKRFK